MTATGLPFRVTTTGAASLAFTKALNWDLISATDAIFIILAISRRLVKCPWEQLGRDPDHHFASAGKVVGIEGSFLRSRDFFTG